MTARRLVATLAATLVAAAGVSAVPVEAHATNTTLVRDCYYTKAHWWGETFPVYRAPVGGWCTGLLSGNLAYVLGVHRTPHITREYRVLG